MFSTIRHRARVHHAGPAFHYRFVLKNPTETSAAASSTVQAATQLHPCEALPPSDMFVTSNPSPRSGRIRASDASGTSDAVGSAEASGMAAAPDADRPEDDPEESKDASGAAEGMAKEGISSADPGAGVAVERALPSPPFFLSVRSKPPRFPPRPPMLPIVPMADRVSSDASKRASSPLS